MKKKLRYIFSFLLVLALILPMAGTAWAADVTEIKLESNKETIYIRKSDVDGDLIQSATVVAQITPEDYDGKIVWTIDQGADAVSADHELNYELTGRGARSITLTPLPTVTEEKTVTLRVTAGGISKSVSIRVVPDKVQPFELKLDKSAIEIGETIYARAAAKYASDEHPAKVTYASSDPTVAWINAGTGEIIAKKQGTVTITATAAGNVKDEKRLEVSAVSFIYSGKKGAEVGKPFDLDVLCSSLVGKYGDIFNGGDEVTFTGISKTAGSALYKGEEELADGDTCSFRELGRIVTFQTDSEKDFSFSVTVSHNGITYSAEVLIKSTLSEVNIYIPLESNDSYSFAAKSGSGKTGVAIIKDALKDYAEDKDFFKTASFEFEQTRATKRIGLLSMEETEDGDITDQNDIVNAADLESLWFIPRNNSGTYDVDFTVYSAPNGKGIKLASGTLSISLNAASLDVLAELEGKDPYVFSSKAGIDGNDSAETLIVDAINGTLGRSNWGGVRFDVDKITRASYAVGTLYRDDSSTKPSNELDADDYIAGTQIGDLYFVPEEAGTYEVDFEIYKDADAKTALASGTLTITVPVDLSRVDFRYVTTVDESIDLDEDDFGYFIQDILGARYELAFITLDDVDGGGTFYLSNSKFVPGSKSEELYSEDYDNAPRRAKYIKDLSFHTPGKPGITYVKFTAYGVKGNGDPMEEQGTFCIFYGYADVPAITIRIAKDPEVSATLAYAMLEESQFVAVYRSATGNATAKPQFSICFTELPTTGLLYKNFNVNRGTGTMMSSKDLNATYFTVGGNSSKSVDTVCYLATYEEGVSDSATYLATDSNGIPLFIGKIRFVSAEPKKVTVSSEGLDFSVADFTEANDPIDYVTFATPASGKLFVTSGSRLIPVTETTKLWISDPTMGSQPISATHYIPRAGQTKDVTLTYTAHTKSGGSYENTILVSTTSRTSSARFSDVSGLTGSWAANSVDFASRYGLVQGVDTVKKLFDPEASMRRCDLVLIFYRMAGSPAVTGTMPYTDVGDGGSSYAKEIYNSALWASQNGIVDGIVTGTEYKPKTNVTRQEYIRILYNYTIAMGISVANNGTLAGFSDAADIDAFAVEAMKWAVANGYTTGTDAKNPKLSPKSETRRAEIVTFLHRYYTY